jgi:hypothetical protein
MESTQSNLSELALRGSGQRHVPRESVGILGKNETLPDENVNCVLALVGIVLSILVSLFK